MHTIKITLLMASSVNGFVARNDKEPVTSWTSAEDKKMLYSEIKKYDALIMGRKSFINFYTALTSAPIYVMTNNEALLQKNLKQIIYTNKTPEEIVKDCQNKNIKTALLLGGPTTNTEFLQKNLIDDIKITLEPKLFGQGTPFITNCNLYKELKLLSITQANQNGSLFLHYNVLKNKIR